MPKAATETRRSTDVTRTLLAGGAMSALFLWLAARDMDWNGVRAVLDSIRWGWVLAYVAAAFGIQVLRTVRWLVLLIPLGQRSWRPGLAIGAVGLAAIFFLPVRMGELVRPAWISRVGPVSFGEAVSTVVVERMIDGLVIGLMLVLVGLGLSEQPEASTTIGHAGLTVGGTFLGLSIAVLLAARFSGLALRIVQRLFGRWQRLAAKLSELIERFRSGIVTLSKSRHTAIYVALTAGVWGGAPLALLLLGRAVGVELPTLAVFVVLGATAIGGLVPAAPTSVGTFHFAVVWALGIFAYDGAVAFNIAVLFHLCQVVANILIYLAGLVVGGRALWRKSPAEEPR